MHSQRLVLKVFSALAAICLPLGISIHANHPGSGVEIRWSQAYADDDDGGSGMDDRGDIGDDGGGDRGGADALGDYSQGGGPHSVAEEWFSPDYEPREVVSAGLSADQIAALRKKGFVIVQERRLGILNTMVARIRVPAGVTPKQALDAVRALKGASADFNHTYRVQDGACNGPQCGAKQLIAWPGPSSKCGRTVALLGQIDTGVKHDHQALRGQAIEIITIRSADRKPSGRAHGTAIASLLVGTATSAVPGLLPNARLIAVDAFHRAGRSEDQMDAFDLVAAIDLLIERRVRVVNLSFAGPANELLEGAIKRAHGKGVVFIAAAGNDGPKAKPSFPGAYPEVISVTAVRSDLEVYRRAGRGPHVDFGAPGVDVWAADAHGRNGREGRKQSGTSYAAPYVTSLVAVMLAQSPGQAMDAIKRALAASAKDLGAPGVDPVFGNGLVQAQDLCFSAGSSITR